MPAAPKTRLIERSTARRIWLRAQRLDEAEPFGAGPAAVTAAVEHLGYVQIDTINVVERCHHHILFSRIPTYRRDDLAHALSVDKTVFEYWAHALAYIPTRDLRYFLPDMAAYRKRPGRWFGSVTAGDRRKVLARLKEGPLSIRDITDDVAVEKTHPWASRKPSKRALELAFFQGIATVNARSGIVKTYDLMERHFGWDQRPRMATARQVDAYVLERALRSQGLVSLESICHLDAPRKPAILKLIEAKVRKRALVPVTFEGAGWTAYWAAPEWLDAALPDGQRTHILSPFDPLIIQRKRLSQIFGYDHLFEAYVPKDRRKLGYFALPVLVGDEVVAAIDMKADRAARRLLIQQWTWVGRGDPKLHKAPIEEELGRFERFQLA